MKIKNQIIYDLLEASNNLCAEMTEELVKFNNKVKDLEAENMHLSLNLELCKQMLAQAEIEANKLKKE